jgi:hypothetical protein
MPDKLLPKCEQKLDALPPVPLNHMHIRLRDWFWGRVDCQKRTEEVEWVARVLDLAHDWQRRLKMCETFCEDLHTSSPSVAGCFHWTGRHRFLLRNGWMRLVLAKFGLVRLVTLFGPTPNQTIGQVRGVP